MSCLGPPQPAWFPGHGWCLAHGWPAWCVCGYISQGPLRMSPCSQAKVQGSAPGPSVQLSRCRARMRPGSGVGSALGSWWAQPRLPLPGVMPTGGHNRDTASVTAGFPLCWAPGSGRVQGRPGPTPWGWPGAALLGPTHQPQPSLPSQGQKAVTITRRALVCPSPLWLQAL